MSDNPTTTGKPGDDTLVKSYNDVPYTSYPDMARHPERLAAIGTLLGLDVAPVATSRVLELACGDGMNLVPIAATLPGATFVGFDLAERPLTYARHMARDLGLTNVRLLKLDMRDLPADLGSFDYIIAHGLYSWIPEEIRAHLMPLLARHLAPNGVAYVSYNTLPGCNIRRVIWDMLRYHTRNIVDKPGKVAAARQLLNLVATPIDNEDEGQQAIRAEVRHSAEGPEAALAHDDMSEPNDPVFFHQFMADAARANLTLLAEARLSTMMGGALAPQVRQALAPLDRLAREQYLDFIHFRRFRESLLCHANALSRFVVQPSRVLDMHMLPSFAMRLAGASEPPKPEPDPDVDAIRTYLLARWPRTVPVAEFAEWRRQNVGDPGGGEPRPTDMLVAELFVAGVVDLRTQPVAAVRVPGDRPEAFPAARWINRERDVIPNLYNEALRHQDPLGQKLLALLDGTRTREDLMAALGEPFSGTEGRAQLEIVLSRLCLKALLVA